jgi:hypothetical protein
MPDRNDIQQEFDAFGQSAGMLKHSGFWYGTSSEVISLLNLQKSQHGPNYYVNVGFWLRALGGARFPRERECHVRIRLDSLVADRAGEVRALLDLESDIPSGERGPCLHDLLASRLKPLLEQASSLEGIRKLQGQGLLKGAAIRGPALPPLDAV